MALILIHAIYMVGRPIQKSSQNTILSDHIVNLNENVFIKTNFRHIYPDQVHHLTATTRAVR